MRLLRSLVVPLAAVLLPAAALVAFPVAGRAQDVTCDRGDREVRKLDFQGNHAFSDDQLALRVSTTASSWARRTLRVIGAKRCLDSSELPRDVIRLRLLYRLAGYYQTKVDTVVAPKGKGAVAVTFVIDEGRPIVIDSVAVTGLDSVPDPRRVTRGLWLAVGQPYDQGRIQADQDSIVAALRNEGYPRAQVVHEFRVVPDSFVARVVLTAVPGERARYGAIDIKVTPAGDRKRQISDWTVDRLLGIERGDIYDDRAIIGAQRNLYQTGAFQHVDIAADTMAGADSLLVLRVRLLEDYMRDLSTEIGWGTLDCGRVRAQLTDKNFAGAARRLDLTGQLSKIGFGYPTQSPLVQRSICSELLQDAPGFSDTLNYSLAATFRQPTLFGPAATPTLTIYRERRSEFKSYLRTTLIGGSATFNENLGRHQTPLTLGYTFEYGKTAAPQVVLCAVFLRCDLQSQQQLTERALPIAIVSASAARIRTDNTLAPSSGSVLRLELRGSSQVIGSDPTLKFAKGVADAAFYFRGGWGNVIAMRLRGGVIYGGQRNANGTYDPPPPQERLYAGGAGSVRGFQQNELGPLIYIVSRYDTITAHDTVTYVVKPGTSPQQTVPTGGNALVIGNLEYRVRDIFFPELLQYTFFVDAGDLWTRGAPGFGLQRLQTTPGLGVRVFSPLGPIQVNIGYNPRSLDAGPAYFEQPVGKTGGEGGNLFCVSPGAPPALVAGQPVTQTCPLTYQPPAPRHWYNRLTFTFSIGPDF